MKEEPFGSRFSYLHRSLPAAATGAWNGICIAQSSVSRSVTRSDPLLSPSQKEFWRNFMLGLPSIYTNPPLFKLCARVIKGTFMSHVRVRLLQIPRVGIARSLFLCCFLRNLP